MGNMKARRKVTRTSGTLLETLQSDPALADQIASISNQQTLHLVAAATPGVVDASPRVRLGGSAAVSSASEQTIDGVVSDCNELSINVTSGEWVGKQWLPLRTLICPGSTIDTSAEYRLVGELGRGGTGVVFQAHQRAVDREVAVKVLREELSNDAVARQQFLTEAITIGGLDHPNVIAIHELGTDHRGRLFYSMKRVDGTAWAAAVEDRSINENLQTLLRVSDAIAYAHSRGLVHRDIKPENVMLGPFGEVLVADWGLAVPHPLPTIDDDSLVSIGGTPAYMAPELAMGNLEDVGPHTDIYLLGAVLFRILAGYPPHQGTSVLDCLQSAADNLIRPTEVQGELMDVARKAMATDPQERYQSVGDFQDAIHSYLQHQESVGLVDRARKLLRRTESAKNYESFGLALTLLQEALELWPTNRRAERLLRDTRMLFAKRAMEQGDLDLAWTLVEAANAEDSELASQIQELRETRCQQDADANRFAQLFAHSPDAVLLTRLEDGLVLDVNDLFLDLVGYDRDQVVGRSVLEIRLWNDPEHRHDFVNRIMEQGHVDGIEICFTRPDGHRLWVQLSSRLMEFEDERMVISHVRDHSAQKLAEYQLQRSRIRLREIQDLAKLGTWELNLLNGELTWGQETVRMLEVAAVPSTLEAYLELVHPEDRDALRQAMDRAVSQGAAFHLEVRIKRANGTYNRIVTRGQPILEGNHTVELFGIFLDVPDR